MLMFYRLNLERVTGIEPVSDPWEGPILPLNYTRLDSLQAFSGGRSNRTIPGLQVHRKRAKWGW